jgi:flagellum-specific ATP synthase
LARSFKAVYSRYEKGRDLVQIGAYVPGSDRDMDEAIALHEPMMQFLQQDMQQSAYMDEQRAGDARGTFRCKARPLKLNATRGHTDVRLQSPHPCD